MYSGYKSSSHTTVGGTTIGTTNGDVAHNWQFGTDGRLTFPDATVQTTAYTGQSGNSGISGFSGTSGFSGINGVDTIPRQDTPPTNGTLWFNTVEGRMYIKYSDVWVDASPLVMPQPDPDIDVSSITFADASVQTTAFVGTAVVDRLTNGELSVVLNSMGDLISSNDIIAVPTGRFIKDCGDSGSTTSMRWINIPDDQQVELIRVYTGDPDGVDDAEKLQLTLEQQTATQSGLSIISFDRTGPSTTEHNWQFRGDGATLFPTLTVPISDNANPSGTGQTLKFSDSTQQAIIYGPAATTLNNNAERIIIQGAPGFTGTAGEGGDVYVWAGPGGSTNGGGGDIKIRAGQGTGTGTGGYLNFQAGDSNTGTGGYINIESGSSNTTGQGGDITLVARGGGLVALSTYGDVSNNWQFRNDGGTVFPNDTILTPNELNVTTNHVPLYSNQLNGTQSIEIPDSSTLRLGDATAWTIEAWVYMTAYPVSGAMTIIDKDTVVGVNYQTYMFNVGSNGLAAIYTGFGGGGNDNPTGKSVESSTNLPLSEWVHLAAVWDGTNITLYQGGVSVGSVAAATTPITGEGGRSVTIGRSDNINYFAGKISNLRIVKNSAVYTDTFTPSVNPLTAITNTSLLTCNASTINVGSGTVVIVNESPWGTYNDKTWTFGTDGGLVLPAAGRIANGVDIQQVGSTLTIATNDVGGTGGWGPTALAVAYDANIISTYTAGSTITFSNGDVRTITQLDDYGPTYIDIFWDTSTTSTPLFPITLTTSNYVEPVIAPVWTFGGDGALEFPDNTVQTTAYVAENNATKVTGTWTVVPGPANYSFTVPVNGVYQLWVRGNVPNGIVTYTATASVTNTNVPVVGTQYAWWYEVGGVLEFTSIPNQFEGTEGVISSTNTYAGNSANVFEFGIDNTGAGNAVVFWGYTTIS